MEFPFMLYRPGSMIEWDGEGFDYLIVRDTEEMAAAKADGWSESKEPAEDVAKPRGRPRKADG